MLRALLVRLPNLVTNSVLRPVLAMLADVTSVLRLAVIAHRLATNALHRLAVSVPQRLAVIGVMNVLLLELMNAPQLVVMNVRRNAVAVRRKAVWLAPTAGVQNEPPRRLLTQGGSLRRAMMITGRSLMVGFGKMMLRKSQRRPVLLRPSKILMTKTLMMTMMTL